MPRRSTPLLSIVTIALCLTTIVMLLLELRARRAGTLPQQPFEAMRLVHNQILRDYVFERDAEDLVYSAIQGMVASLDEYSRFVPPDEVRAFESAEITGTYDGIGVLLVPERTPPTVMWPFPGGPAERVGLRVGDELVEIAGQPGEFASAASVLRGATGSTVGVRVRRGEDELEFEIPRGAVRRPAVKWTQRIGDEKRIGYVYVAEFQRGMVEAFDDEIARLRERGSLSGLVVDIRSNGGGLLDEAVELSNRFLSEGTIVSLKRRDGEVVEAHEAVSERCTLPDMPTVVLIDRRSASAAEVFAAALQDHSRARLVGERTFGKGVVQQIYNWEGHSFRLKMTASHYYTPNGRNLSKTLRRDDDGEDPGGVDPDVPIGQTKAEIDERTVALTAFETPRALAPAVEELAGRLGLQIPRAPQPESDPVLAAAIAELQEPR